MKIKNNVTLNCFLGGDVLIHKQSIQKKYVMQRQKGVVLFTALVLLVILTMLGLSMMSVNIGQEKMSGDLQFLVSSYQAAQGGISQALVDLENNGLAPEYNVYSHMLTVKNTDYDSMTVTYNMLHRGSLPLPRGSGYGPEFVRHVIRIDSLAESIDGGVWTKIIVGMSRIGLK